MPTIADNINTIRSNIAEAAGRSGRSPGDITLIGVTKTVDIPKIRAMIECGVTDIGENKVQELSLKHSEINNHNISWHMLGHVQSNKIRQVVSLGCMIHSVESLASAEAIGIASERLSTTTDILIEINIAGEETKYGIRPDQAAEFIKTAAEYKNVRVRGLMTIAPFIDETDKIRSYFKKMHELYIDIREKCVNNVSIDILSMGMTNDYQIAVEEGSNMVRIGTGIFGARS